jgi:hypothetical protein
LTCVSAAMHCLTEPYRTTSRYVVFQ